MANEITSLIIFGTLVFLVLIVFVVGIILIFYRNNRMYRHNLLEIEHQKEQEVLRSQLEIQEQTFKKISQEIHDNIGQVLSLTRLHISTINFSDIEKSKEKIVDSKQLLTKVIYDLQSLSRLLNADYVIDKGLLRSIEYEFELMRKTDRYQIELNIKGQPNRLTHQCELILFRIFQEVLNNIIKHAGATLIKAELFYETNTFVMMLSDNGKGFDLSPFKEGHNNQFGLGIRSMHNRARIIGADFNIQSSIQGGTVVEVKLPLLLN
jgi:two-component system NarL family sensor kinase